MRLVLAAGLITSSILMHNPDYAAAGEGSELRGLQPTARSFGLDVQPARPEAVSEGLKWGNVDAFGQLAPRLSLYGGAFETSHFNSDTLRFSTAHYRPLGQPASGLSDTGRHPLYDMLPRYSLYNQVTRTLPGDWGVGFGLRRSEYSLGSTQLLSLSAERYFGNVRSAYTLYTGADSGTLGSAHKFQVDYLYGERNTVGLSYTTGRDVEQPGLAIGAPLNDVKDFTLSGRHWFSANWALTYDLSQDQGPLLRRQGLRLGVSRSF